MNQSGFHGMSFSVLECFQMCPFIDGLIHGERDLSHPYKWSYEPPLLTGIWSPFCLGFRVSNVQDEPRRRKSRRERRDYSSRDLVGLWAAELEMENQTWLQGYQGSIPSLKLTFGLEDYIASLWGPGFYSRCELLVSGRVIMMQ